MIPVFLHRGGSHPDGDAATLAPFVTVARARGGPIAVVLLAEVAADWDAYRVMLEHAGAGAIDRLIVATQDPLTAARLAAHHPGGIFVCGGPTPSYQEVLCPDPSWLDYLHARDSIWRYLRRRGHRRHPRHRRRLARPARRKGHGDAVPGGERGLGPADVRHGPGLVPWSVEAHASQTGTLTRLLHMLDTGLADEGWAIDENTTLAMDDGRVDVHGQGQAYYARRQPGGTHLIQIVPGGATVSAGA